MNQPSNMVPTTPDVDETSRSVTEAEYSDAFLKLMNNQDSRMCPWTASRLEGNMGMNELRQICEHFAKFVPETVQRLVAANPEAPDFSMRERDVSVLFIDISGYSSLSERMSPDALNTLVEWYFSTFLDCLYESGGEINEIAGDGLMAIFQSIGPQQHALSATTAALAVLAATEALNKKNHEHPLAVHMGLNSGAALVGLTRLKGQHGTRWTFTARGPMTNLAARLADAAKPGRILVGPETVRRLGKHYLFQRLGCERFKNIADPIAIYRLLGPS
jgi:class 3 adenylate cyclase